MLTLVQQLRQYHIAAAKLAQEATDFEEKRTESWAKRKEQRRKRPKDQPKKVSKALQLQRDIVATLAEYRGGLRRVDLGKRLGRNPDGLSDHLGILAASGAIYQEYRGGPWLAAENYEELME